MFRTLLTISALLILSCSSSLSHAYQDVDKLIESPLFDLEGFIYKLNKKSSTQTLESTLVELKQAEPHFFDHYVLMYKSRSLQTSSFMYPRVLLSSPNSTTVISYNGNPEDHGYEKLEVMRFNPETAQFTFNEISFLNGNLKLSKNNPQKCMSCHQNSSRLQNDPRPNWEPYSIWPGAYSSFSVGENGLSDPKSSRYDPIVASNARSENEMYQKFLDEVALTHPRYKLLSPMLKSDNGKYFPAIRPPQNAPNKFTTTITDNLLNANALRIARLIQKTRIIKDYKKVIYSLARCERIYMPTELFDWHKRVSGLDLGEKPKLEEFAKAIELIFHPYGISTQDWSMDFGTGGKFAFRHRFGGPRTFRRSFSKALTRFMPELKKLKCADMKKEILSQKFSETQNLRNQIDLDLKDQQNTSTPLVKRCASCHTNTSFGAPFIPFNDEFKLGPALNKMGYPRGSLKDEIFYRIGIHAEFFERMPADGYLPTSEEIKGLTDYLNSF